MKSLTLGVALAITLQACSFAPVYERPASPVATGWPAGTGDAGQAGNTGPGAVAMQSAASTGWKDFFHDPALQQLIGIALENNRDLRVAMLNVEALRAQYRIQRSDLFPQVGGDAGGARQRMPADLSPTGAAGIASQYDVGVSLAYELDFFGRIRNLEQSALQAYLATEEAQRSAHIALVAEVGKAYLTWTADQRLLDITRETLATYERSFDLVNSSYQAGVASAMDVEQARTAVADARSQIERYTRQVATDLNALTLLIGTQLPASLTHGSKLNETVLARVPAGLPSELLQQRPDILAAEHDLIAANANIGAARAAFFPSIRLTAAGGTASSEVSGLFDGGSGAWSFLPQISLPIFNAGRLSASLDYAEVQKDIRVARYEKAIQTAFREVADGLAARGTYGAQLAAQQDLVAGAQRYFDLAEQRYREGVDSYLAVLDAQRLLFSSQQQLVLNQLAQLNSEIDLYRALGGGWHTASVAPAAASADPEA
ncbi:efflux transporter outer membrane subunit [Aeromonas caviae]|uniref:efflux transporter outer membrane subunit n=1 Tax=Aeromonas caviae TaxID=648 RepID=UPI003F54A3BD